MEKRIGEGGMRPRRAHRQDVNHAEIRSAFQARGFTTKDTHMIGDGFPDLIVAKSGYNFLVEAKDGNAIPSKRRLTDDEQDFHRKWGTKIWIIESVADVEAMADAVARAYSWYSDHMAEQ